MTYAEFSPQQYQIHCPSLSILQLHWQPLPVRRVYGEERKWHLQIQREHTTDRPEDYRNKTDRKKRGRGFA